MTAAASSAGPAPAPVAWEGGDLVVTRDFPAPREQVFAAWTDADRFSRWWGPHGSTLRILALDARPGGSLHFCHGFDDHEDVWVAGVYQDVIAPERLSFTCHFSDPAGGRVDREGFPGEMTIIVTFHEHAGGTRVVARHVGLDADQGEVQGWQEGLDRLATLLADSDTSTGDDR